MKAYNYITYGSGVGVLRAHLKREHLIESEGVFYFSTQPYSAYTAGKSSLALTGSAVNKNSIKYVENVW